MRLSLLFILFFLAANLSAASFANTRGNTMSSGSARHYSKQSSHDFSGAAKHPSSHTAKHHSNTKHRGKNFAKSIFTPSVKVESKKKHKDLSTRTKVIKVSELRKIVDSFPKEDKQTLIEIKKQIATWPKEIFDEISDYREFIISSRNVARQKYKLLSPEAKSALETEKELKSKLSSSTVKTLEKLEVEPG